MRKSRKVKAIGKVVMAAGVMLPGVVMGQESGRLPGVIDRPVPQVEVPKNVSLDAPQGKPLKEPPTVGEVENGEQVVATLQRVEFQGVTVLSDKKLQKIIAPYLGRPITKADLAQLKFDVTSAFYDRGYILVKVVTPPQDLSDGVLEVDVYEAKVGNIVVDDERGMLRPELVHGLTGRVHSGTVFQEKNVESMISDVNDLKNVEASLNLQPGKDFGTTDLHVAVREAEEDVNRFTLDNYGAKLTGQAVAGMHLEKSNLLHWGETFSADLRGSNGDLWSLGGGAEVPTSLRNVTFESHYLHSENNIGDRLKFLDAEGETDRADIGLSSKIINTRNVKATVRGGFEWRQHESRRQKLLETRDDIRQLFAESSYLQRGINTVWYASGRVSRGVEIMGANHKGDPLASRAFGDPQAWRFEPVFLVNWRPMPDGTLKALATGQYSTNTLLSSDLFILGGYGSVRGFEPAQEAGENGYQFSVQYDHDLPYTTNSIWRMSAGPFVDGGAVYNRLPGQVEDTHLYSAGIGFQATGDLVPAGETKFRLDWAHPIGSYDSQEVSSNTFYFGMAQDF